MRRMLLALIGASVMASAAEADALRIDQSVQRRHLPFNAIMDPVFSTPESGQIVSYSRCGDSAIWTGHYLAAEAFRYASTNSPEALEQIHVALGGIAILLQVTQSRILARCAFLEEFPAALDIASEERLNGVYRSDFGPEKWIWIGNTSRDQYAGVYFGLTAVWNLVNDAQVRESVRWIVNGSLSRLLEDGWIIRIPGGPANVSFSTRPDLRLMMLKLGARVNPGAFGPEYQREVENSAGSVVLPILFDTLDQHSSYFKFNLAHITFYGLLSASDSGGAVANYRRAWDLLRRTTDNHGNAFFDRIALAVDGPSEQRDVRANEMLNEWLKRPERDTWVDLRGSVSACGEPDRACEPIPVARRVTTDFIWQRSPFQMVGGGFGKIETAGLDYILPYWMGRYFGVAAD